MCSSGAACALRSGEGVAFPPDHLAVAFHASGCCCSSPSLLCSWVSRDSAFCRIFLPDGFFWTSGHCSSGLSPAGHGCLRCCASLVPQWSCPTALSDLSLPHHRFLLTSNPVPLRAATSVIPQPCHLRDPTPSVAVRATPQFHLPGQFCVHLVIVSSSRGAAPRWQEPCWGLCKPLLWWRRGWLGTAAGPQDGPGAWRDLGALRILGRSLGSAGSPGRREPGCHP